MKINNIKALDYRDEGTRLVLTLAGTSLEEILHMDSALLKVTTDDGDTVEAFVGYDTARVAYDLTQDTYTVILVPHMDDTTAKALAAVEGRVEGVEKQVANTDPGPLKVAVCAFASLSTDIPDDTALDMAGLFPSWEKVLADAQQLPKGRIIEKDGQLYRVEQAVTPAAHQVPGGEGMLAIYRPIDKGHAGTEDDPIPWVLGMNCKAGQYFSYNGRIYRVAAGGDMIPCTWPPDTPGLWQWEMVKEVD